MPTAAITQLHALTDRHQRVKRKLRVSLTDRCNFRCPYCMPENPEWAPQEQLLSLGEMTRLVGLFVAQLGITHLRLTGGEPLLRQDLEAIISDLGSLRGHGLSRISLTTNGALLSRRARTLKTAGLDDLNVSLDALDGSRFLQLSGGRGAVEHVLEGIEAARASGLPLKVNTVVVRGQNDDQILPLANWACESGVPLRFIEFMPLDGRGGWSKERVFTEAEILVLLKQQFRVEALPQTQDPARYYLLDGQYRLGVISTISNPFCASCDRLRLTATGELYSCLFSTSGRDLRTPMRADASNVDLMGIIRGHVWNKEAGYAASGYVQRPITMHALGG